MHSRPQLHFTPAEGWLNDPLGLTWQDGTYHLFFQHVPGQTAWAPTCHWGHAVSADLVHWQERPIALAPGDGDGGCWSGSVVTPADGPRVLFYTSVATSDHAVGRVRTARPVGPDLDAWRKDPGTVVELPADVRATTFRDPFVFHEGERWWMLVGAGLEDGTATALAYVSDDLTSWEYSGPVAQRHRSETSPVWTGALWECPQLLRIGDRHVLVVSVWDDDQLHHVACAVGQFADGRFEIASWHRLTWGDSHYAASAFHDRDGRPGLVCWLRGVSGADGGWTGAISFPYLLTLRDDRPALELHASVVGALEASSAVHTVWRPGPDPLRLLDAAGEEVVRIAVDRDVLSVQAGSEAVDVPWDGGDVRVVLDGPVLELVLGTGVVALSVPPSATA